MSKTSKRPRDANQLAKFVIEAVTEGLPQKSKTQERAAKGGKVGGAARARTLTEAQRIEIARAAATARWKKAD